MKKTILIAILISFITTTAQSQEPQKPLTTNKFINENIFVHVNSNFLLTGEKLYYKIYCLTQEDKTFSTFSKIAYLELIDSNNKTVFKQKTSIKNGVGYGDVFINTDIETGTYKLISYTNWMKNTQNFYEDNLYIVNPYSKNTEINKTKQSLSINNLEKDSLTLLNKEKTNTYGKREKITFDFSNLIKNNYNNFSVSVRKKTINSLPLKKNVTSLPKKSYNKKNSKYFYLPELRGSLIKGKVFTLDSLNSVSNIKLTLSVKNGNKVTKTAITNKFGEFYFNIKNLNSTKIILQMLDHNINNYVVKINNNNLIEKKYKNFPKIKFDNNIIETIKQRSLFTQIENAYYNVKRDSIIKIQKKDSLFKNLKTVYNLDDYKRFKTVKETFTEITKDLWVTSDNKIRVRTRNYLSNKNYLSSLLIVDNHIIPNHNYFIEYDTYNIKTVSVITEDYFYGNQLYQGVVTIDTFNGDYTPQSKNIKEFDILPVQNKKKYFFQQHNRTNNKRIPDFRTQLYWNPILKSNKVVFYSSDVTGEFVIEIEGFSQKGKPISLRKTFFVH